MNDWSLLIAVSLGGGVGAAGRYLLSGMVQNWSTGSFPSGTLAVNLLGSLLLGFIVQLAETKTVPDLWFKLFLTVGLCGGFTTFSTFSLETFRLLQNGSYLVASLNVFGSFSLCLFGLWLGMVLGRML